ncbi:MAG: hypothetical protein JW395_2325 [Nitrospira sp.]|nr:hypothetical protein [Nitrospira sp.]
MVRHASARGEAAIGSSETTRERSPICFIAVNIVERFGVKRFIIGVIFPYSDLYDV